MSEAPEIQADNQAARDKLIQDWINAKAAAAKATEAEKDLRQAVVQMLFPNAHKGTQRYDLGGGYGVKLQQPWTYTLFAEQKASDRPELVQSLEDEIEALGPVAKLLLARLIAWKPELSATEYEKLDVSDETQAAIKREIDKVLTTKPGSPQLAFEEPKAK